MTEMFARNVLYFDDHSKVVNSPNRVEEIRKNITEGDVYVARNVFPKALIKRMIEYLSKVGSGSLPNYRKIAPGCPNFHRLNCWDPRAYVQGCFHQFVFFPWNQDVLNLFALTAVGCFCLQPISSSITRQFEMRLTWKDRLEFKRGS